MMDRQSKNEGVLGSLYTLPFKAVNLPFRGLRQYYGTPRKDEKYTGNIIQKKRLKKILPLIFNGEEISEKDRLFMNMFNNFITSEGRDPVDQSDVKLKCEDCKPYLYKRSMSPYRSTKKSEEEEEGEESTQSIPTSYKIKFNDELKPKNTSTTFKKDNSYGFSFLGKKEVSGKTEYYFKNKKLDKDDYLIFIHSNPNVFGIPSYFDVYQNNLKRPLNRNISLGKINAKIY